MYPIKIEWITEAEGGRKSIPPDGVYYSVSRFLPEDTVWQNNAWSVVFHLEYSTNENGKIISYGSVKFLMDEAPQERMINHKKFEIYEGPKKVADVYLLNNFSEE